MQSRTAFSLDGRAFIRSKYSVTFRRLRVHVGDHAVIREAEIASRQPRCFPKLAFYVVEGGVVVYDGGADARRLAFLRRLGGEEMLAIGGRDSGRGAAGVEKFVDPFHP